MQPWMHSVALTAGAVVEEVALLACLVVEEFSVVHLALRDVFCFRCACDGWSAGSLWRRVHAQRWTPLKTSPHPLLDTFYLVLVEHHTYLFSAICMARSVKTSPGRFLDIVVWSTYHPVEFAPEVIR